MLRMKAINEGIVGEFCKGDILVKEVMQHPHSQHETHVPEPINRNDFQRIFRRQISVAVKGNEQKRAKAHNLPADKKCFKIAGENHQVVAKKKQQQGIEEPLKAFVAVEVIPAEDAYQSYQ